MFIKFITAFVLVILLGYAAYIFSDIIPWWGFAVGVFIVGLAVPQRPWLSWLSGFAGMFACWGILSWSISSNNEHLLASKMATILPLGESAPLIILITALIAALVGGFASLTGTYVRKH